MTITEMIRKYNIELVVQDGKEGLCIKHTKKLTAKEIVALKAVKAETIVELKRRAAEKEAIRVEREAVERAETEAIRTNQKPIPLHYHDGEYLSGYKAVGIAEQLLAPLGLVKEIDGWGSRVNPEVIDTLGDAFTLAQAKEYAAPILAAAAAKKAEAVAARQAKFNEAAETGQPVLLRSYSTECDGSAYECSMDIVCEYAQPDGSVRTKRVHTH